MSLGATIHTFVIELADADRGVYQSLQLRVARHPSESAEYLVARVLAYCLEHREGLAFSKGLAEPGEPALFVRAASGERLAWIEIGLPDAARLHKASKAVPRVAVYLHKGQDRLLQELAQERIHRADTIEIFALDRELIAGLAARLERRMELAVARTGGHLYVTLGTLTLDGAVERLRLASR